jgi:3-oxoacyl-[acyl-carrier protein] reductase
MGVNTVAEVWGGRIEQSERDFRVPPTLWRGTPVKLAELAGGDPATNAGIVRDNYLTFMKEEEWNDVLDTDLKGAFHCIKVVGKEMMKQKAGRIVNIASDAGLMGDLMRANYASAKAGLLGLTKTAAREFAAHGITVNAVSPGIIETDMIAGIAETRRSKQLQTIPQARFGKPEEVANAVVFLASDDAGYITGEVLCVDGGLHTR